MRARSAARAAAVAAIGAAVTVATAVPALALTDGDDPGKGLSAGMTVLIYIGIPVAAFLVIATLAVAPSMLRRPRYRPGRPWTADPLWFAGPDDADAALRAVRVGTTAKGGASAEW